MMNPESDRPSVKGSDTSAEPLERNGDEIRADMDRTLDALERKFSPSQLLDQSAEYLREHGASVVRGIGTTVRQYPVPTLLTCTGVLWLVTSLARGTRGTDERFGEAEPASASDGGDNRLRRTAQTASRKVRSGMHAVQERTAEVSEDFSGTVRDHPIVIGAMALAVGAVLGAVIPLTETEKQTLGPVRNKALAKAEEVASKTYETVQQALTPKTNGPQPTPG